MNLSDLMDGDLLAEMLAAGFVREQRHAKEPLRILNYTAQAQYDRVWNEVTMQCRGLIVNDDDLIVARPWRKFFNLAEHPELDPDMPVRVYDKLDGSLGILYPASDGWCIATRGSFTSEQAIEATRMLHEGGPVDARPGFTYLFEILYPENRIVVDYGGERKLVLLDIRVTETGEAAEMTAWDDDFTRRLEWASDFEAPTLRHALELPPRPNSEGVVLHFEDGLMLKLKQEDYVELHRIITGLNKRIVWEALEPDGQLDLNDLLDTVPDEFHAWIRSVASTLLGEMMLIQSEARDEHNAIVGCLGEDFTRKDYALLAVQSPRSGLLFKLLDEKEIHHDIWKSVKPEPDTPRPTITEDTA